MRDFALKLVLGVAAKRYPAFRRASCNKLIFKTDKIGDFIFAAEALRIICASDASRGHHSILVSPSVYKLAVREIPNAKIIVLPKFSARFSLSLLQARLFVSRRLSSETWSHLINFRHNPTLREDLMLRTIPVEKTIGLVGGYLDADLWPNGHRSFRPQISAPYPEKGKEYGMPVEMEANRRLLELNGISSKVYTPSLRSYAVSSTKTIMVFPYGGDVIRNYPAEQLVRALVPLSQLVGWRVVFSAEPSRQIELENFLALAQTFLRGMDISACCPNDISETIDIIAKAGLVVGMESAPAHIACALGKPGVFIIGGGHYGAFGPWSTNESQIWLSKRMECYNCNWNCVKERPECIQDVPIEELSSALLRVVAAAGIQ